MATQGDEYRPLFGSQSTLPDRPLFGVSSKTDRVVNLVLGFIAGLLFSITFITSFFAHRPPHGLNIYFGICIFIVLISHLVLIYWYRQGDLDPKFRLLIYYNAFSMITLTTCALAYFFIEQY